MSRNLVSDGWHRVAPGCPITVDLHDVDQTVEVVIGDRHGQDDAVTLVLSDPDTCHQLIKAATEARDRMLHLHETEPAALV